MEPFETQALAVCERALRPITYFLPDNYDSRERFEEVLVTLNRQATPGIPYDRENSTIGGWLGFDGFEYDQHQKDRLWFHVQQVFNGEFDILYKTFIKQEPHKQAKIRQGRWRLIICFPLCVQVAWKMLFDYLNVELLQHSLEIPVQHGFQLMGGGWKHYHRQWKNQNLNAGTDVSAFDFSTTWKKVRRSVFELRARLTKGRRVDDWKRLALRLYEQAYVGCNVQFPCGTTVRINVPAIQKSGSPNTIADNGLLRFYESVVIALSLGKFVYPLGSFVGDDALECIHRDDEESLVAAYKRRGWTIKQVEWGMNYVGHDFTATGPMPSYLAKHLYSYRYLSDEVVSGFLESMVHLYAHSPHTWIWHRLALLRGLALSSEGYYKVWYDFHLPELSPWEYRYRLQSVTFDDS